MDTWKIKTIQEWFVPTRVRDVQSFLGFTNFYRRFIKGFSVIAQPLIALTYKDATFEWITLAQKAFDLLKQAFTTTPILFHLDPTKPFHYTRRPMSYPADLSLKPMSNSPRVC